jgi:hypothetical protein
MRPPSDAALASMSHRQAVRELDRTAHHYLGMLSLFAREYAQNAPLDLDEDLVTWKIQTSAQDLRNIIDELDDIVIERKRRLAHAHKLLALRRTEGRTPAEIATGEHLAALIEAKQDA